MLTLRGRTCVIAGGSGQIGRSAVKELVRSGMNVVMLTHMTADAEALAGELAGEEGKCTYIAGRKETEVFADIYTEYGSVDVLIVNTGEFLKKRSLEEYPKEEFDRSMNRQWHILEMINAALPYLRRSSAGRIILTTSASACMGFNHESLMDAMSRGAERSLVLYLAKELAGERITVNAIEKSGMLNDHEPKEDGYDAESIIPYIPLGRNGESSEFAAAAAYLASEEAGFVTGQILHVSGGLAL